MSDYQGNIIIKNPATPTGPAENGSAPGIWKLSEALAFKRQGIWPTQGVSAGDPYFSYVSMLLSTTSLGNANNNLFVDSSGAFNPISRNGNATQGSATPYSANWSNYFDASGDYLTVPSNSAFNLSTGDFTVELFVYKTVDKTCTWISGNEHDWRIEGNSNGRMYYVAQGAALINPATVLALNTWYHIAVVKSGATTTVYINGVASGTTTTSPTNANSVVYIGINPVNSSWAFGGYLSNIRVVKGTAVYTSNFTPPTSALTAISGTSLLTCQSNRFRDASSNNFTITRNGDTRVTDFAPFSPGSPGIVYNQSDITNWSGYFDGSGDYLTVPNNAAFSYGTGDFTMEAWVYKSASGIMAVVDSYTTSGGTFGFLVNDTQIVGYQTNVAAYNFTYTVPQSAWTHIAFVRTGGNLICYVNGTSIGSQANSANFTSSNSIAIGCNPGANTYFWNGYISNLRIVKGTAVYTGNFTPPTTNLTAISGTSLLTLQNAAFTDNSTNNFILTQNGNVTVTGNSPFNTVGYWSNYFDGSGDYLTTPSSASLALASGDFTIEAWVYPTALNASQAIIDFRTSGSDASGFFFGAASTTQVQIYAQGSINIFGGALTNGQWQHVACVRSGSTVTLYINGVSVASGSNSTNWTRDLANIGAAVNTVRDQWNGYISNLRVVKGTAVYTSNFTVPTTPLTAITNTSLLTCQNGRFIDNSTNAFTVTANGNVAAQSFDPFYTSTIASNGGSMYFDGSGDYLVSANNPSLSFGSGDFTLEFWLYLNGNTTNQSFYDASLPGQSPTRANAFTIGMSTTGQLYFYTNGVVNNTSSSPTVGQWAHIALARSGTSLQMFLNGQTVLTLTNSTNFSQPGFLVSTITETIGSYTVNGYISNMRGIKGAALYTSNFTPPTAPLTPTPNTVFLLNGMNAGIYDATAVNDMETVGNAQVTTAVSKFGGSSVYFDGTGDYLISNTSTPDLYAFGSGDFTIEFWLYLNSTSGAQIFYDGRPASTPSTTCPTIYMNSQTLLYYANGANRITGATLSTGTWYHIALSRSGTATKMFLNGTQTGSTYTDSTVYTNSTGRPIIGNDGNDVGVNGTNGYIDDLRVTKGYARYTANFTPPTQAFPTY